MSEKASTPTRIHNLGHETQSRPFTSFYISDILGEHFDDTQQLMSVEPIPLQVDGTQEGIKEPTSKGTGIVISLVFSFLHGGQVYKDSTISCRDCFVVECQNEISTILNFILELQAFQTSGTEQDFKI